MSTATSEAQQAAAPRAMGGWLKGYVLFMLLAAGVVSYVDRQVVSILLDPIKSDLGASDTQMGMLTGLVFTAFFVLGGIPLARWADVGNRRTIISLCIAFWSAATAACGLAQNFLQIAIARMGVAAGEAGTAPAGASILGDLFSDKVRTRVFAMMSVGSAIGIALGIFLGGVLHESMGWRTVFYILGGSGLVFAVFFRLTVPEPARVPGPVGQKRESTIEGLARLWKIPTYRFLAGIAVLASATAYAAFAWVPAFLGRVHGMSHSEIGAKMGVATVAGLIGGNLCCGYLADFLGQRDRRWVMWVAALGQLICVPTGLAMAFMPDGNSAVVAFGVFMFFMGFWPPPVSASAISIVEPRSRALVAATIPILQAVGGALGPLLVGVLNDLLASEHGQLSIRYSLAASIAGSGIASILCFMAGPRLSRDYRKDEVPVG